MENKPLFRHSTFRPRAAPSDDIPLGARSVGHYRIDRTYREPRVAKHFLQLFWGVAGAGTLVIHDEERILRPGEVAVYLPGMEHHLWSSADIWEYRWWTMDGPLAADIAAALGLRADVYRVGPAPTEQFEQLTRAIQDLSARGERRAGAMAYALLSRVRTSRRLRDATPRVQQALDLIHRKWTDPLLGIEAIAARINVHRSTLSREFTAAMGIPPVEYITRLRVQNALSLLKQSTLSMAEIARRCGYADPNYFSRTIRRLSGHSPLEFRRR